MTDEKWQAFKQALPIGSVVEGEVVSHQPYGIFIHLGYEYLGLVSITKFLDVGRMTPEQYPPLGSRVQAVVIAFRDDTSRTKQAWLSTQPSARENTKVDDG